MVVLRFEDTWNNEIKLFSYTLVQGEVEDCWNKIKTFTEEQLKSSGKITVPISRYMSENYPNAYILLKHIQWYGMMMEERHTISRILGSSNGVPSIIVILKAIIKSIEPSYFEKPIEESTQDEVLSVK